jgi:quercetin dioxygenase-like cupin family protein
MEAPAYHWSEVEEDHPIALLHRKKILGDQMLVARVRLDAGCHVAPHHHASEQIAMIQSGRVLWTIGEPGSPDRYAKEMVGGEVLVLPSNVWHSVDAIEDTEIIDVLSPPGAMGVDSQKS